MMINKTLANITRSAVKIWIGWLFWWNKKDAMMAWKVTGKRHWVVMIGGRMRVVDARYLKRFNRLAHRKGIRTWDARRLSNDGLFATPPGTYLERKKTVYKPKKSTP